MKIFVKSSRGRPNTEEASAVLWYFNLKQAGMSKSARHLNRVVDKYHNGTPNKIALADSIRKSKLATESKTGFALKPGSQKIIRERLPILHTAQPVIDHSPSYLSESLWQHTRGYIEHVCRELNGSFHHAYYDSAAVMLRRLLETLIIESYEKLERESEIKDSSGNYFMLSELAERACGERSHKGLKLGRDSTKALKDARSVGNWSAHARRFIAHAEDLTKLQDGVRLLVQELVHIAELNARKA